VYVASRELRNGTGALLKRVQAGEEVVITVRGRPVAQLVPVREVRRRWIPWGELVERLNARPVHPGLWDDLDWISGGTTDDLGPIV
jgi:prevent-host-death family protein